MIKKILNFKSIHIQHASMLMIGTLIAQFINLVSSPIITRLFSPEQFGILSLYTSIIGPLTVLTTMRLETALVISPNENDKSQIKAFIYRLSFGVTILSFFLLIGYYTAYKAQFQLWYFLIPLGLFLNTILLLENSDKNFLKDYKKIATAKIVQSTTMGLSTIFLGYLFNKSYSLIISSIMAIIIAWIYLRFPIRKSLTGKFLFGSNKKIFTTYSRYFYFTTPASLLDTVSQQIPIFILSYYATKEMTGYYGLALKVLILPTHIVGASIAQVFLRRFSELWTDLSANLKIQLLKTWGALILIGILPFGALYFYGEILFSIVFGPQWLQAGTFAALISPMLFVNFVSGPSSSAILVQNSHKIGLLFGLNALVTRSAALFYGVYKNDIIFGFKIWVIIEIINMIANNAIIWINITKRDLGRINK